MPQPVFRKKYIFLFLYNFWTFQDFFMEQLVHEATRERNILDIFATNDHELVPQVLVEDNVRMFSDHKSIFIKTNLIREARLYHSNSYNSDFETLNFYSDAMDWSGLKREGVG